MTRRGIDKTYKLYIGGGFPRSESGRTTAVRGAGGDVLAHVSRASGKDLRDAVDAARSARSRWAAATAYNRGQVLYRIGEMMEGRHDDFASAMAATGAGGRRSAAKEVAAAVDRIVAFAGWCDKYAQVLGSHNPVAGPYYDFTIPEPMGVVGVLAPETPPLLGLVTMVAPALCAGNAVVAVASTAHPLAAVLFAEACATADVPAGAVNVLTGDRHELLEPLATHREVAGLAAANLSRPDARAMQLGAADAVTRVHLVRHTHDQWLDATRCEAPWTIEPFVEMKTIWHPAGA